MLPKSKELLDEHDWIHRPGSDGQPDHRPVARLGSIPQAESGTLAIMVGGQPQAFATVEPLLREFGQKVTHIGLNGQGLVLKLAINISLAVQPLAFSEGLLLAERAGVDPELAAKQRTNSRSAVADTMLTRARELGYGHRDLASLHEVLAKTVAQTPAGANPVALGTGG
jgi:3-hydroxyisobutyrate dehydrogenase-like beta-hydroxyacid dehydrogenase